MVFHKSLLLVHKNRIADISVRSSEYNQNIIYDVIFLQK